MSGLLPWWRDAGEVVGSQRPHGAIQGLTTAIHFGTTARHAVMILVIIKGLIGEKCGLTFSRVGFRGGMALGLVTDTSETHAL